MLVLQLDATVFIEFHLHRGHNTGVVAVLKLRKPGGAKGRKEVSGEERGTHPEHPPPNSISMYAYVLVEGTNYTAPGKPRNWMMEAFPVPQCRETMGACAKCWPVSSRQPRAGRHQRSSQ